MSYFELRDYIRDLGYNTTCTFSIKAPNNGILVDIDNDMDILDMMYSLEYGDVVEVFVKHLVDEPIVGFMLIGNRSHMDMGESGSAFNTSPSESENFNFGVGEDHLNGEDPFPTFSTSPLFTTTHPFTTADNATADGATVGDDDIDVEVEDSDYSTEYIVKYEVELVGDDEEEEYGSDVHEEVRELRAEQRTFQRHKRREKLPTDTEDVPVGEAGPDLGFDETETGKISHEGRLGSDEPYFASCDEDSFECCDDDEHECGRARRVQKKMMDDLIYYNINYWCKVYFNTKVKCDFVDNNSECFHAWILAARHKTIITMLEEIRVKMMTRMTNLREFPSTWKCNFSPMVLKVLKENISTSIDYTFEFNGVVGFEVKEGLYQPKVDIARRTCICRVWQLRGIQYPHDMTALYFTKFSLYDYVENCYSKETYLRTYANVIEPLTNIEMWPVSTNPTISPPEITNISGRLSKARSKEARETKKSWNLPRTGLAMTYSICHVRSHNKRGCPQREGVKSSTRLSLGTRPRCIGTIPPDEKPNLETCQNSIKLLAKEMYDKYCSLDNVENLQMSMPQVGAHENSISTIRRCTSTTKRKRKTKKKTSPTTPSAPPLPTTPIDFPASSSATPNYHA
ncbi:hypothetical protein H5410_050717 [Solanum commersonii]|uniref:Zinc finger PMZ-type domain-containing protein n=1 Tax=Solanum commersonii TaxID=4109 RepID=A0A9J5WWC5_SOLCO|nr:hypothetical protein H5410_050717 [Solanum commersonii]